MLGGGAELLQNLLLSAGRRGSPSPVRGPPAQVRGLTDLNKRGEMETGSGGQYQQHDHRRPLSTRRVKERGRGQAGAERAQPGRRGGPHRSMCSSGRARSGHQGRRRPRRERGGTWVCDSRARDKRNLTEMILHPLRNRLVPRFQNRDFTVLLYIMRTSERSQTP